MVKLIKLLQANGFECETVGSDIKVLMNNFFCFRIHVRRNDNIAVSFNGMKPSIGKSKTENKGYKDFINAFNKHYSDVYLYKISESGVLQVNNIPASEFPVMLVKLKLKKVFDSLTSFEGIWHGYKLKRIQYDGKTCVYRDIKNEFDIVREAFTANTYEHHGMTFEKDDVVLDLGANIGCFTLSVFNRVKKVIAVEPEEHNCDIMRMNIKENNIKNCKLYQAAVVGNKDKTRELFCGWCAGMYSLHTNNHNRVSVTVECVNIQDLIDKYNPTKIKFDIKGSEIECVHAIKDWGRVNQVAFDYCFDINGDLNNQYEKFNEFKKKLKHDGFDITPMERDMKSNWNLVFTINKMK